MIGEWRFEEGGEGGGVSIGFVDGLGVWYRGWEDVELDT